MKSIYYFLVGISLLAFGFSGVATSINARLGLVYKDNPSPKKQDKPQPKKHKEAKNTSSKITHFSLLTGEITTTDALVLPPSITANNSVAVQGGGSAVPGGQLNYTVVINNAGTDATGVAYTDVLNSNLTLVAGSVTATPIVVDDSYNVVGNVGIVVNAASGLLANDVSPLNLAKTATVVASGTSTNGTYTIAADGSFTYTPNAGFTGSDSFTYTSNIGSVSATGTVNITVSGMIWFVNAAAASSGTGTLASPFKAISDITGTAAGHTIFLYTGTYTGSLTLLGTQKLIGQGAAASLASITGLTFTNAPTSLPATGGTNPTWNSAALTLGSGNDVQGINFNSTTGTTMTGASVGALKVRDVSLNNTAGQALQITAGGALDAQFKSISASGAAKGISVNSSTGNLQVLGTGTTDGTGGTINNMTTRGVEFILCTNITLKNMDLTSANTADGTNCDASNGNSGCNGAVYLRTVNGATLDNINISGTTSQMGINANNVTALSVKNSNISNCGNNIYEGCMVANSLKGTCDITNSTLSVSAQRVVNVTNLGSETVTLNVTNSTLSDAPEVGLLFEITGTTATGNATLNVKNSNFLRNQSSGVLAQNSGNSTMTFNMDGSTIDPGTGVGLGFGAVSFGNGSGRSTYNFNVGTIAANTIRGRAGTVANVLMQGKADGQGKIQNNLIQKVFTAAGGNAGAYLSAYSQEYSTLKVDITGNQCKPVNTSGVVITDLTTFGGTGATTQYGMDVGVGIGSTTTVETARTDAYIHNNTVFVNASGFQVINLSAGGSESAASTYINCSQVTNNTTTQQNASARTFRLRNGQAASSIRLATSGTNGALDPMEYAWDNNGNTPVSTTNANTVVNSGAGSFTIVPLNTCLTASNPPSPNSIAELSAEEIVENPTEESPVIEEVKTEDTDTKPSTESTSSSARKMAGETVLVNGAGAGFSLPAGKSTTIKYSATINSTPTTCPIPDQGTVSGSNFTSVQTNLVNTSFTVSPINTVSASSAAICSGGGTSASAVCPVGTVTWYTAASGGSSVATGSPYNPTNITAATSYYAACVIGTCESSRTLVRSVTINANPTASPGSNTPVCVGSTLNLTSTTATSYLWNGPDSFTSTVEDPSISNVTIVKGGTYTLRVTNAAGCTGTATTQVVINSTQAPTAPTATPSSRTTTGSVTLSATGCSGGTLTWFNAATNVAVPSPNNQPSFNTQGTFNFYAKCTGANTCVSDASINVSVPVTLCTPLVSSPGNVGINWTGLVSTDWNNPCNWNPAWVPDATNSAVVINLRTNQPTISGTVPNVNLIYVNSGATLTVSSGGTLNSNSTTAAITLQGGNIINDGTINTSGGGSSVGLAIGANASIINRGTITTNNLYGASLQFGNLTFTNESTGIFTGDFKANNNTLTLTNRGTINYGVGTYALSLGSAGSSVINDGTISIAGGSGISNPSGSTITNNACGKILITGGAGLYENGGTTTNAGLIQMLNTYDFTNTGTFTNNGVLKANTVSGITNNKMVITNACPIFTLGGSNNYTVSGIFTNAAATTSAGTYTSVGNKFTANNTIPTGTQTLYAQVTDGTCTFVVPFDFNNVKPTAVSVNNTTVCPGRSVTLSATCASGTPTWYTTATGGTSIGTGASLSNSPTVATTYYVACEATNCVSGRVATNAVTISSLPSASASSNSPVCAGTTLNLTGGSAGNTYAWTSSTGFTSASQSPTIASVTSLATGTYTITVTNTTGCTASATTSVTVNALPTATASSNSPICVGNTLNLTGGGVGTAYAWISSTGFTSNVQSPTISNATVSASGTYTVTVTNNNGCISTASVAVTVNALPTATASSNSPICVGNTLNLTSGGGFSYSWAGPITNLYASTLQNPSITNARIADGGAPNPYIVTVTDLNGCQSTASVVVTVNATPTATASSSTPTICAGNTVSLTGGGIGTYAWTSSNGFTSTAQSPTISNATVSATGTYTITVTNLSGCTSTASVAVTVNANPTATASSNSPICVGNTLNLTSGGGSSYTWSGPAINPMNSTTQNPSIPNAVNSFNGIYTVRVTNNGCTSTTTIAVVVNDNPTATASTNTPTVCAGNTISLTGGGVGTYAWTSSTGFTSTAQSPTIANATISASGTYTITVTNGGGCTSTASVAVTVNALPTATASSSTPTICSGTTLNLTGGGVGTAYAWTGPNGYTSSAQSPTIASPTVLASGVYRITVTNVNNCTSTATTSVTVNPLPVVDAGANQTICEGSTASLTAICNLLTVSTTLSGTSEVPANASLATGTVSGTYDKTTRQLLLTISFNELTSSISAAHIHKGAVGVNGPVQIGFPGIPFTISGSFTYTGTLTTTQEADLLAGLYYVNVHNSSFPGGEIRGQLSTACVANSFVWNPGSLSGQTVTVSPIATLIYTVTASNSTTGCSTTATTTVNVNPKPVPTIGSNSPICAGTTLNLTSSGGTNYAWTSSNGFTSTDQNPTITNATVSTSGTYTVTVTNVNGCINTATTVVTVNALPTATASNNSPICSGATLNLTGGGGVSYAWTSSTGYTSTAQSPSIPSATASMSGTYTITVTNANGCTSTATTSVIVNPVVSPPVPQANTQIIFGASITLTATGCSGVNDVLKWYKSSDNSLATMPVSPTATTNFYAKCETTLNGITCISANSTDVTVTVLQPTPPVATGTTNCLGTPTTLTATGCSGSVGTFVLKWYQNADDALVTMPVSPTTTTDYYAKCEQTFNSVTAVSGKSNVVTLTILNPATPVSTGGTIYLGNSISLTATGCTGTLGTFTLKWYQTSDNALVTMPVSPTVTTQYYSKCEQTANSVTCLSPKSNDVMVIVVNRIFVDITKIAAPIQNGTSWATAYGNLQTGLAAAAGLGSIPVEVWVAKGLYKPTTTTDKTISFVIPSGAKVIGGFAGTETTLAERNFRTNISILSGEIGNLGLVEDNVLHVVRFINANNQTLLDGFTIQGGYAAPADQNPLNATANVNVSNAINASFNAPPSGGGILAENSLMTIANCIITNNQATFGAGVYLSTGSNATIKFCKFTNNTANFGGAIYHYQNNSLIENTLISGNKALGGAIFNHTSNPILNNVTIAGNRAFTDSDLGSIYNTSIPGIISYPVLKNCIVWGNSGTLQPILNTISYSIVEGGYPGTANLNQSPKFVNPQPFGVAPIATGDYHIMANSPTTDTGDNGTISLTDLDLDGNLRRFNGGRVDRGAYEFQGVGGGIVISIRNGAWNDPNTWNVNRPPFPSEFVIIDQNHTVQITTAVSAMAVEYRTNASLFFTNISSKLNIGF